MSRKVIPQYSFGKFEILDDDGMKVEKHSKASSSRALNVWYMAARNPRSHTPKKPGEGESIIDMCTIL